METVTPAMSSEKITVVVDALVAPLIPDFLVNRRRDIIRLNGLVSREDYEGICITGHNLRGCGASYGFQYITDVGTLIEAAAIAKNQPEITRNIGHLQAYLDNLEIEYTSELS